jgi:hypothetical protein
MRLTCFHPQPRADASANRGRNLHASVHAIYIYLIAATQPTGPRSCASGGRCLPGTNTNATARLALFGKARPPQGALPSPTSFAQRLVRRKRGWSGSRWTPVAREIRRRQLGPGPRLLGAAQRYPRAIRCTGDEFERLSYGGCSDRTVYLQHSFSNTSLETAMGRGRLLSMLGVLSRQSGVSPSIFVVIRGIA